MNEIAWIDLGIILILLFFLVRGYQQGLIRQAMTLVGFILGLKIASDQYLYLSTIIQTQFNLSQSLSNTLGFIGLFVGIVLITNTIGWALSKMTGLLFLSFVDRGIGAVMGLVKGGVMVYILLLLVSQVPYNMVMEQLDKSILAKDLLALTPYIEQNLDKIIRP